MKGGFVILMLSLFSGCSPDHVIAFRPTTNLSVWPALSEVRTGGSVALSAAVSDGEGGWCRVAPVLWQSSDEHIIRVSRDGVVDGLAEGEGFVVAEYAGQSDSARVVVLQPGPFGPGREGDMEDPGEEVEEEEEPTGPQAAYPNEPAGFRTIAASDMSERFAWPPAPVSAGEGEWWQWREGDPNTELLVEAGIPGGPHFNRTRFAARMRPGVAPVNWGGWASDDSGGERPEFAEIYFSMRIRLVGQNWESQRVGTKMGFFGVGTEPQGARNDVYVFLEGGTRSAFTVRLLQQNVTSRSLRQNRRAGPAVFTGRWHQWEIRMAVNDLDRANGVVQWWIDGELVMEHRDAVFRTREHPHGFLGYKWNPTWGGMGGPLKLRDDYVDISDVRLSGRPLDG